jgi:hypothetical protein
MSRARRSHRRLAVIAGVATVVLAIGIAISLGVVSQSSFRIGTAPRRDADDRFEAVRRRFPDRGPLLEITATGDHPGIVVHRERLPVSPAPVTTVRGLAWRAADESLMEVRLPFWFVRMKLAGGRASLGALLPAGWDVVRVSSDDLGRRGPGLLLDERRRSGDRLLLWAE